MPSKVPKTNAEYIEEIDRIYQRFQKKMLTLKQEQDRIIRRELARIEQQRIAHLKTRIATQ